MKAPKMKMFLLVVIGIVAVCGEQSAILKAFTTGYTKFASNVYNEIAKNSGNFVFCPMSASTILSLVYEGAKGPTAEQLASGINIPESREKVREIFEELTPKLQASNDEYTLTTANKMYVKEGFEIAAEFKTTAEKHFGAEIDNINFERNTAAAKSMNAWVKEKTDGHIEDLVVPESLDADTRAVLINAMYFHGKWTNQFNKRRTKLLAFHVNEYSKLVVDTMEMTNNFLYHDCPYVHAKFLEMTYEGGDVSMTFVLPNDPKKFAELETQLETILAMENNTYQSVHVQIPKFKTETTTELKPLLQKLGVHDIFEDSSELVDISANKIPLKITKAIQKAFIEVEENGTTAAAATAVNVSIVKSAPLSPIEPEEFIADRPFLYFIKSKKAGVLFVGRYVHT